MKKNLREMVYDTNVPIVITSLKRFRKGKTPVMM